MAESNPEPVTKTTIEAEDDWRKNGLAVRNEFALKNNLYTDVNFVVGEKKRRFSANKSFLSLGSSVFAAMLSERWCSNSESEIEIPDVEPAAFFELLRFIYSDKADLSLHPWSILYAAKKYDIDALKNQCIDHLKNSLTTSNVCFRFMKAKFLGEVELMDICSQKISEEAANAICPLIESDDIETLNQKECFLNLNMETICLILEMDSLKIEEVSLFKAILRWGEIECVRKKMEVNKENTRSMLEQALPLVRYRLMSSKEFTHVVCTSGILSREEELATLIYLSSKPRPANLRPIPRYEKLISIVACHEGFQKVFRLEVNFMEKISALRLRITNILFTKTKNMFVFEFESLSLHYENTQLHDACLLSDYGIDNDSIIRIATLVPLLKPNTSIIGIFGEPLASPQNIFGTASFQSST